MAIEAPTGNKSSIETQVQTAQRNAELAAEPTAWTPVTIFKAEEGVPVLETPEGRTLESRLEEQGSLVRLRGAIQVASGEELKSGVKFAEAPAPATNKEVLVPTTAGTAKLTVSASGFGRLSLSVTQAASAIVSFDNVTYTLS